MDLKADFVNVCSNGDMVPCQGHTKAKSSRPRKQLDDLSRLKECSDSPSKQNWDGVADLPASGCFATDESYPVWEGLKPSGLSDG
jgi:hypothetical protein